MATLTQAAIDILLPQTAGLITHIGLLTGPTAAEEVFGGGYARQPITWAPNSGTTIGNGALIVFDPASTDWGTITYVGGFSAITAGTLYWSTPLDTPLDINTNDQLTFAANSIRLILV